MGVDKVQWRAIPSTRRVPVRIRPGGHASEEVLCVIVEQGLEQRGGLRSDEERGEVGDGGVT